MEKIKVFLTGLAHKAFHSDGVRRAAHTFIQAFFATFVAGIPMVMDATHVGVSAGKAAVISLVTAAVAAGLSALKTSFTRL